MDAQNPLQEGLLYMGEGMWSRKLDLAMKFDSVSAVTTEARNLSANAPVKVFLIQNEGNRIGIADVPF